jgi:hypothetical protein
MDRVTLETIMRREVADYSGSAYKAKTFYLEDLNQGIYTVVIIPDDDYPVEAHPGIVVMARFVDDHIVIDEDITDKPLYVELMRCGIPREQMILRYAGEKLPKPEAENPSPGAG